jgi:hypothetical protein
MHGLLDKKFGSFVDYAFLIACIADFVGEMSSSDFSLL